MPMKILKDNDTILEKCINLNDNVNRKLHFEYLIKNYENNIT